MAGTGKPSMVAAAACVVACGLAGLIPTAAVAQIPFMIPNFNLGGPQQHYRSGSSHYSTRSHAHHEEDKAPDKAKEKDATQPDSTASASAQHQQQMSGPPPSHDAAPSGGSDVPASPPPAAPAKKSNDDQPAFAPSR
jgi:hypothetical protein